MKCLLLILATVLIIGILGVPSNGQCLTGTSFYHRKLPSLSAIYYSFDSSIPNNHAARGQIATAIAKIRTFTAGGCYNMTWQEGTDLIGNGGSVVFKFGAIPNQGAL